ncbi:hypothetical protein CYMTET_17029, partial [Cymbomonas tetramitiformis]
MGADAAGGAPRAGGPPCTVNGCVALVERKQQSNQFFVGKSENRKYRQADVKVRSDIVMRREQAEAEEEKKHQELLRDQDFYNEEDVDEAEIMDTNGVALELDLITTDLKESWALKMLKQDIRFVKRRQQAKAKSYATRIPDDELHEEDELTRNLHRMMMLVVRQQRVMVNHQKTIQEVTDQLQKAEKVEKRNKFKRNHKRDPRPSLQMLQTRPEEPHSEDELGEYEAEQQDIRMVAMSECGTENSSWMGMFFGGQ